MNVSTLLNAIREITVMETGFFINLDFLGEFARVIIEGVGIIGLGIIVFTLVLKAITLPFDIYQRVKMRKQTLIMRNMKDDLEKLQKQYAGDKAMYNQKMVELQKKNGYSILGACLPMIISLVILIVAFQGFRAYAEYANVQTFENMAQQYNAAVLSYCPTGKEYSSKAAEDDPLYKPFSAGEWTEDGIRYRMYEEGGQYLEVKSTDETLPLYYIYNYGETAPKHRYYVDTDRLAALLSEEEREAYDAAEDKYGFCAAYIENKGAEAAATFFRENGPSFWLIAGNVWYPDVSYDHPIPSFGSLGIGDVHIASDPDGDAVEITQIFGGEGEKYDLLVSCLQEEQDAPNGYFVLVILSVGFMVLSQFISMRSNKESNQYQTVDGKGARTQKIMLVVMPLIYGMFAFLMSAAFSIYMIVSSISSILITLISNLVIGHVFNKKEEKKFQEQNSRILPWMKNDKNDKNGKDGDKKRKNKKN